MSRSFSSGLCGCFNDCGTCCYGCWCTSCLYGENVRKLDNEGCCMSSTAYCLLSWVGCHCFLAAPTRKQIRQMHGLEPEPCGDCCVHCWCSSCAVCQEARELKARGVHHSTPHNPATTAVPPTAMMDRAAPRVA